MEAQIINPDYQIWQHREENGCSEWWRSFLRATRMGRAEPLEIRQRSDFLIRDLKDSRKDPDCTLSWYLTFQQQ